MNNLYNSLKNKVAFVYVLNTTSVISTAIRNSKTHTNKTVFIPEE